MAISMKSCSNDNEHVISNSEPLLALSIKLFSTLFLTDQQKGCSIMDKRTVRLKNDQLRLGERQTLAHLCKTALKFELCHLFLQLYNK